MALDPRTPVIVGVGQVTNRPDPSVAPQDRPHPLELMAEAITAAARDCAGDAHVGAAGTPGAGARLLARTGSVAVVRGFGWRLANPGLWLAERLGIAPGELVASATGGNTPLSLVHRAARMIARGELDVAIVTGGDCLHTRRRAAREGVPPAVLGWPEQRRDEVPAPIRFGEDRQPATDLEAGCGLTAPVVAYPLLENAWRGAHGWSLDEHRARIGRLWSAFSAVAADNPFAWLREIHSPSEIVEPSATNRMVAFPYTKLCTANVSVDQAAAVLCCSVEAARAAGVPEDRWVFPLAGAEATDHWFLSERPDLHRSPAIAAAGRSAFALGDVGPDDVGPVDLYSCFPVVVEIAAVELGLTGRSAPLTVTGGLTFFGGPGNDYTTHGIASLVSRLRDEPGSTGLVTGLGWYATKHALGVLASRPPAHAGAPFRWEDAQPAVDAQPRCPVDESATGPVHAETYAVVYDRDGRPERATVACRTPSGARTWAQTADAGALAEMVAADPIGRAAVIGEDRSLRLA